MRSDYVELNTFLKVKGLAGSGGHAKHIIRDGLVRVNGETETRNKRKLMAGDRVELDGSVYTIEPDVCLKRND